MATDFGIDFSSYPDISFTPIGGSDPRVVAEALYRRFSQRRGSNPFHPDDGLDLREWLNESFSEQGLADLKTAIEREAEKDERVAAVSVGLDFNTQTSALTVTIGITTADGPFKFVLLVSQLDVKILQGA